MIKFRNILALILLTIAQISLAKTIIPVATGGTTVVDVAGTEGLVTLKYEIWTDDQNFPSVKVITESNGFECQILDLTRTGFVERVSMPAQITYEIPVQWSPGADLSSCDILIAHPHFKPSQVRLEMNY